MNKFNEDNLVEKTVIKLIKQVWKDDSCHINAYKDEDDLDLNRETRRDVVLKKILLSVLQKINPGISDEYLQQSIDEVTRDRSNLTLVNANREVYQILKDGLNIKVSKPDGKTMPERIKFFDFENPDSNHFCCVSQLWVVGEMYTRRPDVILYVNGIPLILVEVKASHISLVDAYKDNIRDYKDTVPQLFWYNMGIIISNGIENKFGSLTAPFEFFNEWKKVESENEQPNKDLSTVINGICDKKRLLDILENYILFDDSKAETKKIVPRYFQYFGVNNAFERVIERKENKGKLGVFWHTQGSGKSYSMVFLSQKVLRKLKGNFTFVIVTDRSDLDRQAYKNFATVGAVYENEVHAESIKNLHELLNQDHRQIFTTIQKFQDISEPLSTRDDIIVMTDEAHRTQYDTMAQNMRKALPNASFIGFTGTPLMKGGEEKTRETFGEYVSKYNFGQSVSDGATVPLYYENRVPKLENVNEKLEQELGKIMDFYDLNDDEEEKVEQEFSTFYHIVTREDRLNAIARDIVQHFVARGYNGKAMVVSIDKKTAIRMYTKVKAEWDRYLAKLRMDLARTNDDFQKEKIQEQLELHEDVDMAVVVSQGQNEIADMEEFEIDIKPLRDRMQKGNLEEEFKKADGNLRIVFVCAMWMTGFDVPNLSTLYLDKPLKNHTLMQTIARANRVAEGKTNGIIVDYIGVFQNIEKALAIYASTGSDSHDIIKGKEELVDNLQATLKKTKDFLTPYGVDIKVLLEAPAEQKLLLIDKYANAVLKEPKNKKDFLNLSADLQTAYRAVLPDPSAEDYYHEVTAVRVIASRIRDVGLQSFDVSPVKKDLEDLLDKSIQTGEYMLPKIQKLKDLSKLNADALFKFFNKIENKNLQVESMLAEVGEKIAEMMKRNKQRAGFMDRLTSLLDEYNSGAHDINKIFEELVELANALTVEEQRAVKESLNEEELAIFDILLKENINPKEREEVKKTATELLEKLKQEKLVLDWREREPTRAGVKTTIWDMLYAKLPEPAYEEYDCEIKATNVYNFVYEHYKDAKTFVYA